MMFRWAAAKSAALKRARGVSFEELLRGIPVTVRDHPTRPDQKLLYLELEGYIWIVPFVKRGDEVFLKTAFPSRKHTRVWRQGGLS